MSSTVLAVGWLSPYRAWPRGPVSEDFLRNLERITHDTYWARIQLMRGYGRCALCGDRGADAWIGIVYEDVTYVAPAMLAHLVRAHGYCPPQQFQDALAGNINEWFSDRVLFQRHPDEGKVA